MGPPHISGTADFLAVISLLSVAGLSQLVQLASGSPLSSLGLLTSFFMSYYLVSLYGRYSGCSCPPSPTSLSHVTTWLRAVGRLEETMRSSAKMLGGAGHHEHGAVSFWCLECCDGLVSMEGATTRRWSSVERGDYLVFVSHHTTTMGLLQWSELIIDVSVWFIRSVEVLERWAKDPILLNMLQRQQAVLGHTLPLGTFLCKPVQRILKYHLLLKACHFTTLLLLTSSLHRCLPMLAPRVGSGV